VALAENKVATGTRLRSAITESIKELTAQSAHFKYSDLLRFVAEKLQDVGIHPKELKSKLDKSIARSRSLIRLEGEGLDLKLTTKSHWKIEESLLKDAEKLLELRGAVVSKSTTSNVVQERSTLSKEQAIAVEGLTRGKGSIRLLQGSAGAGKTFTLDTVREAFEKSGYKVIGGAVSGLAKEALRNDAQIETNTVAYYLKRIENLRAAGSPGKSKRLFDSKTVLVLDEASMIDAKGMQKLLAEVRKSKATVILVGDERQLQAIGAGGPFKFLLQSIKPVTLTENRRQANADDRKAVTLVRAGKVKEALESYLKRGRLTVGETRADAAKCLVQAWADAGGSCNPRAHSIFTETRKESAYLNRLCQQIRVQENISDSLLKARLGDTDFYKGDRILFQKADKSLGIENGFRGEVTAINPSRNTITVLLDTPKPGMPKRVTLSLNGKASEDISLGYAATTHKMQGQTTDHAYVFVGGGLSDRAMTYTQLTRGRHTTNLFVDEANAGKNLTTLARSMTRDRTKTLAHEHRNESQTHSFT
jgi:ATP-dependent exoDNAse (exonuclease V) alpha subunit